MPLPPRTVTTRGTLRALVSDRQQQSVSDRPDPGFEVLDVGDLAAPGQRPLIVRGLRDRPRPPRRRHTRQAALRGAPRLAVVLQAVRAPRFEVLRGERPEMRAHQAQHLLILRSEVSQPVTHRHARRSGDHERRRHLPQTAHRVHPLRPDHTTAATTPNDHHPQRSPIRQTNPRPSRETSHTTAHNNSPLHGRTHAYEVKQQQFTIPTSARYVCCAPATPGRDAAGSAPAPAMTKTSPIFPTPYRLPPSLPTAECPRGDQ
jgi:hypothetical protein